MLLLGIAAVFVFVLLAILAIAWPWLASTPSDEPLERRSRPGCDDDEAA
jgi:hypothetical protein